MKNEKVEKVLKRLGITESYWHFDEESGNLYYMFLAPGRKREDFTITYYGNNVKIKLEDQTVSLGVALRGMKFDVNKSEAVYRSGTLVLSIPQRSRKIGQIEVGA